MFISRWDVAVTGKVPENLRNRLGIAIAHALTGRMGSCSTPRAGSGSSTPVPARRSPVGEHGHQGPLGFRLLYIESLAAPLTVNTMPKQLLKTSPSMA